MVHMISETLSCAPIQEASNYNPNMDETVYSDGLYCKKCIETNTEQEAYDISQDPDPYDYYGTLPGVSKDRCRYCRRHTLCTRGWDSIPWNGSPGRRSEKTLHLNSYRSMALLRVARTVYREASAILCANTIFSFKLAHTLTAFSRNLNPLQRSAVKTIHLDINVDPDHDTWSWPSDNIRGTLASLPSLRNLRLTIRQSCKGDLRASLETLQDGSLPLWEKDLIHFRLSSIRNVTVIVEDIDSAVLQDWNRAGPWRLRSRLDYLEREGHWTMGERAECALVLRDKLLAI